MIVALVLVGGFEEKMFCVLSFGCKQKEGPGSARTIKSF